MLTAKYFDMDVVDDRTQIRDEKQKVRELCKFCMEEKYNLFGFVII